MEIYRVATAGVGPGPTRQIGGSYLYTISCSIRDYLQLVQLGESVLVVYMELAD